MGRISEFIDHAISNNTSISGKMVKLAIGELESFEKNMERLEWITKNGARVFYDWDRDQYKQSWHIHWNRNGMGGFNTPQEAIDFGMNWETRQKDE